MDLQIKTFRLQSAADEQTLNEFLAGKIVRHWATSFSPSTGAPSGDAAHPSDGTWSVMIAYEIRMSEARPNARHDRDMPAMGQRRGMDSRGDARNDARGNARPERERREEKPREKTPREEYQPQIPAQDLPLYEAVRKWRNARARDERVKPFELFNNRILEEIVKTKPATSGDLKALVPEMEAKLWDRYHNELLGFMEAAKTTNGHTEPETTHQEAPAEAAAE